MSEQLRKQLSLTVQCYNKLKQSFENNLQVIQQRQQEIYALKMELQQSKQEHQSSMQQIINEQKNIYEAQIERLHNINKKQMKDKQEQMRQLADAITTKFKKQNSFQHSKSSQQIKSLKAQFELIQNSNRKLIVENSRYLQQIKENKKTILYLEQTVVQLSQQKNSYATKFIQHHQQLQGVRNSNTEWQVILKDKLKEVQIQKQQLEQQMSDYKLHTRDKIKQIKEQNNKKLIQLAQQKQSQIRPLMQDQKQMRYKYQKVTSQQKSHLKQIQSLKHQKNKLEQHLSKLRQNQYKSSFQKNQKQYEYLLKIFQQDKKQLKNQIEYIIEQKKLLKNQLDEVNEKRQHVQKAVERLKIEMLNKAKQNDDLRKDNKKLRYEFENKERQYMNQLQQHSHQKFIYTNEKNTNINGFPDKIDVVKDEMEYSKVFTQDIGLVDDRFFQSSNIRSPANQLLNNGNIHNNIINKTNANLMKKIGQLQNQNHQYKTIIKSIKDEIEHIKKYGDEEKQRQINMHRDKANLYWEKANDKEHQIITLREQNGHLKQDIQGLRDQVRRLRDQARDKKGTDEQLKKYKDEIIQLKQQVSIIEKQRNMLEEISSQLRVQNNLLKDQIEQILEDQSNGHKTQQHYSESQLFKQTQLKQQYNQRNMLKFHDKKQINKQIQHRQTQPLNKVPKKLHDLLKQKKMLEISGKRATMEERVTQIRLDHVGTQSQKQILQKIKVKNKTPPKVPNYSEMMKANNQKRSRQIETLSQKQVYEKLKYRQNSNSRSPVAEKGINYIQLRDIQDD